MTGSHFYVAGAVLERDGMEKSQNAFARGCQLSSQLVIVEGSLAELLRFCCCQLSRLRKTDRQIDRQTDRQLKTDRRIDK